MSVAVNLLPDTRQKRQKHKEQKRLFTGVIITILVACGAAIVIEILVVTSLKLTNKSLTTSIQDKYQKLESMPNLTDALTLQNHVTSLSSLYGQRAYMSNFFAAYSAANPSGLVLASLAYDKDGTLTVNGTSQSYTMVAKLARALDQYKVNGGKAFDSVDIKTVGGQNGQIGFTVSAAVAQTVISKGIN